MDNSQQPSNAWKSGTVRRTVSLIGALCLLAIVLGFFKFSLDISESGNSTRSPNADAIVVLTGGPDRIRTGLELLENGEAKRLLITGVHPDTSDAAIRSNVHLELELFECCVEIDRLAQDTRQNAYYASMWVKNNNFKTLIVVTSNYHMPRSLLLMRRAMPDIKLIPFPVGSRHVSHFSASTFRINSSEYLKYLLAWLHIGG